MDVFTSLEFKKLLNETETRGDALIKFIRSAEKFDSDKKNHDIAKSYISSSADCAEVLLCLKGEITPYDLGVVFRCLNNILTRTASDLQEFYGKVGMSICDAILRSHLQKIYHALGLHQSPRTVSGALKMLTLLVMQGKEAARDMAHQLDFKLRCFNDVLTRFKGKFSFEIRKSYIHFAISFFMSGDARTINRIFDVRGFVSSIFQGLNKDKASIIQMVLTAVLDNGVKNLSVSKSSKARFFAEAKLLKNISRLFEWDGIFDIIEGKGMKKSSGKHFVQNLVENFLYHVCCPFDYGINFMDKELGIGEKCKNHVLLDFILHLLSLSSEPVVRELIVKILKACPDLLHRFMKDFRMTLEPKNEEVWLRNCELVTCVYANQPNVAVGLSQMLRAGKNQLGQSTKAADLDFLVKMILPGVMSPNFSCLSVLKHCMKSKSLQVRQNLLNLLLIFMGKLEFSISFMLKKSNWENAGYTNEDAELCYAKFEDALLGNHLNIPFLIQLWKEASGGNDATVKVTLLKIIKSCQKLFPADVQDTKFDFTRLLNTISASSQLCKGVNALDLMIIDMLSESPQMYRWFKVFDKGNTPFKTLLNITQNSPKTSDLYKKSVQLCEKVMQTSGILLPEEICEAPVWIENIITDVRTHNDQVMVQYLNEVCSKVARMPMKYFDILSAEMKKDSMDTDSKSMFWESLPVVDIEQATKDDWASIVIQQSKYTSAEIHPGSNQGHGVMSLLAVATLDSLKEAEFLDEERKIVDEYLIRVYSLLLNQQQNTSDGKFFACVYEKCISEITEALEKYPSLVNFATFLTIWTKKPTENLFSASGESISAKLQLWLWKVHKNEKPGTDVSSIVSALLCNKGYDLNSLLLVISQCLLYFNTLHISNNLEPSKELLIEVMRLLQEVTQRTQVTGEENASKFSTEVVKAQQLILQSSSIQALFFQDLYLQPHQADNLAEPNLKELASEDVSLSSLCTYAIAGLIMKKELHHISQNDRFYISKIVQSITELLGLLPNGLNSEEMKNLFLPRVFYHVQDFLTAQDCKYVFDNVTEILPTIQSKKVGKLTSRIISTAIKKICSLDFEGVIDLHKGACHVFDFLNTKMIKKQSNLIAALSMMIQKFPSIAINCDTVFVETLLGKIESDRVELCEKIIRYNPLLVVSLTKSGFFYNLSQQDQFVAVPLAHQVLLTLTKDFDYYMADIEKLFNVYWRILASTSPWERLNIVFRSCEGKFFLLNLLSICSKFGMEDDIQRLLDGLNDDEQFALETNDVLAIVHCIFSSLGQSSSISRVNISSILVLMKMVTNCNVNGKPTFSLLKQIIDGICPSDCKDALAKVCPKWPNFVKQALKNYYDCPIAFQCMTAFVRLFCADGSIICDSGIDIETLRGMLVSHSKFLPSIVMDEGINQNILKCSILELHYELADCCSINDLSPTDFCYLLSAYTATVSKLDQIVLKTLLLYERKGVSLDDIKPFLWGKSAISSYRARKNLGDNLWKKPGSNEVLSCIDDSVMDLTLKHFPVRRRMVFTKNGTVDFSYHENDSTGTISASKNMILKETISSQNVYDPCFLLPSFLHILSPENLVDCKVFVRCGALSYLMCCLASHCHVVRAMAANCLILYYQHAQTSWFSENNLTMYLIRCVRNTMPVKEDAQGNAIIAKLPMVVANFLAAIVQLHQNPKDHMFSVLHRYLLIKPQLDLKDIPEFFVLFFSAEMESKIERTWVVNLICNSIRDQGDVNTINKRNLVQLLMCLHDSAVSDNFVRRQVFEVLERLVSIRSSAFDLVKNKGLISWLSLAASDQPTRENKYSRVTQTIGRPGQRRDNTKDIIRVVSTLCKTLDSGSLSVTRVGIEQSDEKELTPQMDKHAMNTSGIVEKMEVERDDLHKTVKRIAVIPFRILKQIISLNVTLQENLLRSEDFDFDFCMEGLQILSYCITDMNTRNTQAAPKNTLRRVNKGFMDDDDIEIMCEIAQTVVKSPCRELRRKTICSLLTIFMAWHPKSNRNLSELWKSMFKFTVTDSKSIWATNCEWVKENLLQLCNWLKTCESSVDYKFTLCDKQALARLYDVIFSHSETLQSNYVESLRVLNELELGEIYDDDTTFSKILEDSCKIQQKLFNI